MWKVFQKNLVAGFIVLLPAIATIYVLQLLFSLIDSFLGQAITNFLKALRVIKLDEGNLYFLGVYTPFSERLLGVGFVLTIFIVAAVGSLKRKGNKREVFEAVDRFFRKIPLANYIYASVEQMIHAFTQERSSFQRVVMIEYPRKGAYTLGFLTGESKGEVQIRTQKDCLNVFLPTTPNPTSGWLVLVPREDVTILDMTVEQGLKFIISGGVVVPPTKTKLELSQADRIDQELCSSSSIKVNVRKNRKDEKNGSKTINRRS